MGIRSPIPEKRVSWPLSQMQGKMLIAVSLVAVLSVSLLAYVYYHRDANSPPIKAATSPDQIYQISTYFFDAGTPFDPYPWVVSPPLTWYGTISCPQVGCWGPGSAWASYGQHLNDSMTLNLSLVNFTRVELNFHLWINIEPTDALLVEFRNSTAWAIDTGYSGHLSTMPPQSRTASSAWMNETLLLPSPIEAIRFRLVTGCCGAGSDGLYLSQVILSGIGPKGYNVQQLLGAEPFTTCNVPSGCHGCTFPACAPGDGPVSLLAPVTIDGGALHPTPAYILVTPARHTIRAVNSFSSSSVTFNFQYWAYVWPSVRVNSTSFTISLVGPSSYRVYYNATQ